MINDRKFDAALNACYAMKERRALRTVTILGASGSVGTQAIEFLRLHRSEFQLENIAVGSDWERASHVCREFSCRRVGFADEKARDKFMQTSSAESVECLAGPTAATEVAAVPVDVVLAAISGCEGLPSIMAAIRVGNRVALANKEALVCGGPPLLEFAAQNKVRIIPVDSEHSAIFQAMLSGQKNEVAGLHLTASGGPFRAVPIEEMRTATPKQALAHPNWKMGPKNTIDSATLANKGLELIEASFLFDCGEPDIEVVINPSSILHSSVSFRDGSMIAQLGKPDMRVAIGYGLTWPERFETGVAPLSLSALGSLFFEPVDCRKFRCLDLARAALRAGQDGPLIFNAANEIGVEAFLAGAIGLLDIPALIEDCLQRALGRFEGVLSDVPALSADALAFCRTELSSKLAAS